MTKYQINAGEGTMAIELTELGGRQAELLEAFGECQEGRCSCPTDEYQKVESMAVQPAKDRIGIRLQSKPGMTLDVAEIAACLDHTVAKSQR